MKPGMMGTLAFVLVTQVTVGQIAVAQDASSPTPSLKMLLTTDKTILRQPLRYPKGQPARVISEIVTFPPGAQTGWHRHDVPVFGYLLEGQLTVSYRGESERVYRTGEAFIEALGTSHNGRNTGTRPARILVVFMGADGVQNTVKSE